MNSTDVENKLEQIKTRSPVYYNAIVNHRDTNGDHLVFYNRPEAVWVYSIIHTFHDVVIQKCSQVGATELLLNVAMDHLQHNRRILFLVPNDTWKTAYVKDRVDGLIKNSPAYKANYSVGEGDSASTSLKTFYGTTIKFAGVRNLTNLFSYPCQVIIVDEFDLCNQENLVFADDRTGWKTFESSNNPYTIKVGNPSIENWGLNKEFKKTNQYFWYAECGHCKHEQILNWLTHFVEKDINNIYILKSPDGSPVCTNCHKPFTRRGKGRYKPVNQGKPGSIGIHIDKLRWDVSKDAIHKLFEKWLKAQTSIIEMENFYNQHLGLPYSAGDHRITLQMLLQCAEKGPVGLTSAQTLASESPHSNIGAIIAGIDQGHGKGHHIHISHVNNLGVRTKLFIGRVNTTDEIENMLDDYNVEICVMDAQGGGIGYNELRSLAEKRSGQLYLCRYRPKDKPGTLYDMDDSGHVMVNRSESLDGSFDCYKHKYVLLPKNFQEVDNHSFVPQMIESVRTKEIDKNNTVITIWKNTSADDHRHADNYEYIAMKIAGFDIIKEEVVREDAVKNNVGEYQWGA